MAFDTFKVKSTFICLLNTANIDETTIIGTCKFSTAVLSAVVHTIKGGGGGGREGDSAPLLPPGCAYDFIHCFEKDVISVH